MRLISTIRLLPVLALALATFAHALAGRPLSRPYVAEHYRATLTLDFAHRRIIALETIQLRFLRDSISEIELDADDIVISSVRVRKRAQQFFQPVDPDTGKGHLTIYLARSLHKGSRIDLQVIFQGSPTKGLLFFQDQAYTVYNTSHWLVVNHEPSNLATFDVSLNVPSTMIAIGNGENFASRITGGRLISKWKEKRAIPDFAFGFAVGPFIRKDVRAGTTKLRYFGTHYSPAKMEQMFRSTPNALTFFSEKAGNPYRIRTYSQILAIGNPQQELGDFTLLPDNYGDLLLGHPDEEWLLAHELAHQWWGIGVACASWSDFWLNEGFATFMADVFLGKQHGNSRYEHEIEIARTVYAGLKASGKDHPLCYLDWKSEKDVGGRLPYFKGAWVLHLLKQRLGEEAFWNGIKDYTRNNWGKATTSRNFQFTMEKSAGFSLQSFFDNWVYR